MNVFDLSEEEIRKYKKSLMESGIVFEQKKISGYDTKYYETVTISNVLIKFFLFFSLGLYAIINLVGVVLSIVNNSSNLTNPIVTVAGIFVICFIIFAIFNNINTNKKKETSVIYVNGNDFIFNFNDGVTETPNLYYVLPVDSIKKIEFIIHGLKKGQLFGSVTFTFGVLEYEVTHAIRFTNLTAIRQLTESKFSQLLDNLFIDGKRGESNEKIKNTQKPKCILTAIALFIVALLLIILPYLLNYNNIALTVAGAILIVTAFIVFLSPYLYTYHLVQGAIVSGVFIIMGIFIPLFIITNSGLPFAEYIIQNNEILLTTIFGIIGLCMYAYIIILIIGKLRFIVNKKYYTI